MTDALQKGLPELAVEVLPTPGGVSNLEALERGDADLALAFSDVAYLAVTGELEGHRNSPMKRLAAVAVLQFSTFHILLPPGSKARVVEDLRGGTIALAPINTGNGLTSRLILSYVGLSSPPITFTPVTIAPGIRRMQEGTLDAFVTMTPDPSEGVQNALSQGIRLMSLSTEQITSLAQEFPFLRPGTIRSADYHGLASSLATVGVDSILLCRTDLDPTLVHDLTRALIDSVSHGSPMRELHSLDIGRAAATSIALHPGASRYYRERELGR